MVKLPKSFWLIAPYAVWMVLMTALPSTPACYAIRTAVVAALLVAGGIVQWNGRLARSQTEADSLSWNGRLARSRTEQCSSALNGQDARSTWEWTSLAYGLLVGLAVFVMWILPEQFDWAWYRRFCILGEGGTQAVAEASTAMIVVRLVGSAFVISVAEELFFRKWLIPFAGFWWMVGLFAIEHDRWLVAALCGMIYGGLYLRKGLLSAIVAHATTNLVLGLWVLKTGQWQFW